MKGSDACTATVRRSVRLHCVSIASLLRFDCDSAALYSFHRAPTATSRRCRGDHCACRTIPLRCRSDHCVCMALPRRFPCAQRYYQNIIITKRKKLFNFKVVKISSQFNIQQAGVLLALKQMNQLQADTALLHVIHGRQR